jgi:hypothetical protein
MSPQAIVDLIRLSGMRIHSLSSLMRRIYPVQVILALNAVLAAVVLSQFPVHVRPALHEHRLCDESGTILDSLCLCALHFPIARISYNLEGMLASPSSFMRL